MRWFFSAIIVAFGLSITNFDSLKWTVLTIGLFAAPALLQFMPVKNLRIYAVWFGIFLIFQTLVSPFVINRDLKTLPPNLHERLNVIAGLPGIQGEQIITTDTRGFRTTRAVDYENDDTFRIFAIGASTTEQLVLDDRSTWTHLLQEQLGYDLRLDVEVINTGVSGLRARHHLATLQYVLELNPDLIIFLLGINDWNHQLVNALTEAESQSVIAEYRNKFAMSKTLLGNVFVMINNRISAQLNREVKPPIEDERGEYYTHQRNSLGRPDVRHFKPEDVSREYKEMLVAISETCKQNEIECLFVTQPTGYKEGAQEEYKKGFWMTPPNQTYTLDFESMIHIASLYNSYLIKFSGEHGHSVCDAALALPATYDVFYDDCHFNTHGAIVMSEVVGSCVKNLVGQEHVSKVGLTQ